MAISSNSNSSGVPDYNEEDSLWVSIPDEDLATWSKTYDSAPYAGDAGVYFGKPMKSRKSPLQKPRSNFGGNQFGRNQGFCNRPKNFQGRRR